MGDEVEKLRTMPEKNRRYYLTAKSAIALSKTFQLKWVMKLRSWERCQKCQISHCTKQDFST